MIVKYNLVDLLRFLDLHNTYTINIHVFKQIDSKNVNSILCVDNFPTTTNHNENNTGLFCTKIGHKNR